MRRVAVGMAALAVCSAVAAPAVPASASDPDRAPARATSTRPVVDSVFPHVGLLEGGTTVRISGTGIGAARSVHFAGTAATSLRRVNADTVTVRSPARKPGPTDITVTTPGGTSSTSSRDRYTYRSAPEPVGGLTATSAKPDSITLRWTASPTTDVDGISVVRRSGTTPPVSRTDGTLRKTGTNSMTSYTDSSLSAGTWSYSVFAYVADGDIASRAASVTITTVVPYTPGTLPDATALSMTPTPTSGGCASGGSPSGFVGRTNDFALSAYTKNVPGDDRPVAVRFTVRADTGSGMQDLYAPDDPATLSNPVPATGGTGRVTIDPAQVPDGATIEFAVQTVFADGTPPPNPLHSAYSVCRFTYDPVAPYSPIVTSTEYPADGSGLLHTGDEGEFVADSDDVEATTDSGLDHYESSFSYVDAAAGRGTATRGFPSPSIDHTVTFTATPTHAGTNILYVAAVDHAGNVSAPTPYSFLVTDPPPPLAAVGPYPHGGDSFDALQAVTCPTAQRCVAIGNAGGNQRVPRAVSALLVETWTAGGSSGSWAPTVLVGPVEDATYFNEQIACSAVDACTAVAGYAVAGQRPGLIAATLRAGKWTVDTLPTPAGSIATVVTGLSCALPRDCTAIGQSEDSTNVVTNFAARSSDDWRPTLLPAPEVDGAPAPSELDAVSCSDATHCQAVGRYASSPSTVSFLVESFADGAWTASQPAVQASNGPFAALTCSSPTACSGTIGIERIRFEGDTWIDGGTLPFPPDGLAGPVICTAATKCRMIASRAPANPDAVDSLVNGVWSRNVFPGHGGADPIDLNVTAVACADDTHCAAVGGDNGTFRSFTSTLSGSGPWYTQYLPSGNDDVVLDAVSCPTTQWCGLAGHTASAPFLTIRDNTSKSSTVLPLPADAAGVTTAQLRGISCPVTGWCVATGSYDVRTTSTDPTQTSALFADTFAHGRWSTRRIAASSLDSLAYPVAVSGDVDGPTPLSCTAVDRCVLVGMRRDYLSGAPAPLILDLRSGGWSEHLLASTSKHYGPPAMVSCASTTSCLAVSSDGGAPVAGFRLSGTSWTHVTIPFPSAQGVRPLSMSCPTTTSCTVIGQRTVRSNGVLHTIASIETLSGKSWRGGDLPGSVSLVPDANELRSMSVSCASATACVAVSRVFSPSTAHAAQYVAVRSGSQWRRISVAGSTGWSDPGLQGVSCVRGGRCLAVGFESQVLTTRPLGEWIDPLH